MQDCLEWLVEAEAANRPDGKVTVRLSQPTYHPFYRRREDDQTEEEKVITSLVPRLPSFFGNYAKERSRPQASQLFGGYAKEILHAPKNAHSRRQSWEAWGQG